MPVLKKIVLRDILFILALSANCSLVGSYTGLTFGSSGCSKINPPLVHYWTNKKPALEAGKFRLIYTINAKFLVSGGQ